MQVIRHIVSEQHDAATIVLDVDKETKNTFMYLSVCTKDMFDRKKGRELALARDPVLFFKLKALDNFKTRALKAVANEMFVEPDDIEYFGITAGIPTYQVALLRRFLKGINEDKKEF